MTVKLVWVSITIAVLVLQVQVQIQLVRIYFYFFKDINEVIHKQGKKSAVEPLISI